MLCWLRNGIWSFRRAIKSDAFEHEREAFFCISVPLSLQSIEKILLRYGYVVNEPLQFEDKGQLLSGHYYYDCDVCGILSKRQRHIRVFASAEDNEYDIYSHDEWTWYYNPWGHLRGEDVVNDCGHVKRIFSS